MNPIKANYAVSVSELKKNPSGVIQKSNKARQVVAILNHNVPESYLVPARIFEKLDIDEQLENIELAALAEARESGPFTKVKLDEL